MIEEWKAAMKLEPTARLFRNVTQAFKAAVATTKGEADGPCRYKVADSSGRTQPSLFLGERRCVPGQSKLVRESRYHDFFCLIVAILFTNPLVIHFKILQESVTHVTTVKYVQISVNIVYVFAIYLL